VISASSLVDRVTEGSGLSDFGPDGWQVGLEQMLAAAAVDLPDDASRATIEAAAANRLTTRLRIEQWYAEHHEGDHAVVGPVIIVGLPRSATTALHHLLALDPQFRFPRAWELANPMPPPDVATEHEDPRRPSGTAPGLDVRHISAVDGPTEDNPVFGLHFHGQELGWPLPTYTRWWRGAEQATALAYHDRVLRLLHSSRRPYQWLLKAPAYLFFLPQVVAQYPGARFLMTHRDPSLTIPSTCSTILDVRPRLVPGAPVDEAGFGPEILEHYVEGVRRAMAARNTIGESRFLDVGQRPFEADAVGTAERIYDFLGLPLTTEVKQEMAEWAVRNRRGSRGEHHYTAAEYGLDDDGIRRAFAAYLDAFGEFCR
jgi:hypothetical protein